MIGKVLGSLSPSLFIHSFISSYTQQTVTGSRPGPQGQSCISRGLTCIEAVLGRRHRHCCWEQGRWVTMTKPAHSAPQLSGAQTWGKQTQGQ